MPNIFSNHKLNPDYIEKIFQFEGETEELVPISIPRINFTEIRIKIEADKLFVKLVDSVQRDRLSILTLHKFLYKNIEYYEVRISKSYINKRGYLRYLFLVLVVDYNYKLISDKIHSIPGSMNFWKKIKNEEVVNCYILKPLTNYKRKYENQNDYEIWGINNEYFEEKEVNIFAIEDLYKRKVINQAYYNYVIENEKNIKDCNDIRLTLEKV